MARKGLSLLLAAIMLFSLSGCTGIVEGAIFFSVIAATSDDRADKDAIFEFVCENEEELLKAIEDGALTAFENRGFIQEIAPDDMAVDFSCGGAGMGPSTSYVGFYYTPDHDMTAAWCAPSSADSLVPYGDGFAWWEENGDNHYYTEHICGNFYYYEASF